MNLKTFAFIAAALLLVLGVSFGYLPDGYMAVAAIPIFVGATYTEDNRTSDWLKWEEDSRHSRDAATILSGQNLKSGAVMGRSLVGAAAAATAFAANTGNGVMGAIVVSGTAKQGTYKLIVVEPNTNAGTFEVEDPEGKIVGRGNVAAAYSAGGLAFTLADGATDFVSGDGFDIKVTGGVYKWKEYDPSLTDGAERAAGILINAVNATAADTPGAAITRQAIIGDSMLTWKGGTTAQQKADALIQLVALGIIARTQV